MALANPQEHTVAASVTSLARSLEYSTSPVFSVLLLQGTLLLVGVPFTLAGTFKAAYNLMLWSLFRWVQLKEET